MTWLCSAISFTGHYLVSRSCSKVSRNVPRISQGTSERRREDSAQTGSSVDHLGGLILGGSDDRANSAKYPARKRRNCRCCDGYNPARLLHMSSKAGFTQPPWEDSGSVLQNGSIRTTQHSSMDVESDVVGDDAHSRVDAPPIVKLEPH